MKKNLFLIGVISALFLIVSCKKNDSEIDKNSVKLVVMEPLEIGDTTSTSFIHQYVIKGAIVAPGSVDIREHGFVVKLNAGSIVEYLPPLGSGRKAGSVEQEYNTPFTKQDMMITLYVILQNGDTLTSDGESVSIPNTPTPPYPLQMGLLGINNGTPGYVSFSSDVFNYDTAHYSLVEQGIEYALLSSYNVNQIYTDEEVGPAINNSLDYTFLNMQFQSNLLFADGTDYQVRVYAVGKHKTTNVLTRIYSGNAFSFTSQMP